MIRPGDRDAGRLPSTSSVAYQLAQLEKRRLISRTGREWSSCRLESPKPPRAACEAADRIRSGPCRMGFGADRAVWVRGTGPDLLEYGSDP